MLRGVRQGAISAGCLLLLSALAPAAALAEEVAPGPTTLSPSPTTLPPPAAPGAPEENGLKVGEGRMHPFLEIEPRYDSNVMAQPADQGAVADMVLHIRPGFTLDVPSNQLQVSFNGNADLNWYQGVSTATTRSLNRVLAAADLGLTANPQGDVYAYFGGGFTRSDQTTQILLTRSVISDLAEGRFRLGIQPGGHALLIEPGYVFTYGKFEPLAGTIFSGSSGACGNDPACDTNLANLFDFINHRAEVNARLRFLPKTAFLFNGAVSRRDYQETASQKFDSTGVRLSAGLEGLLTPRFSITARAGYGGQPNTSQGYSSVIGQLELGFLASQTAGVHIGYQRDFEPMPIEGSHYNDDKFYLDGRALLGGRVSLHAAGSVDLVGFVVDRNDFVWHLEGGPDVQVTPWFTSGVGLGYTQRAVNGTLPATEAQLAPFTRVEAWLRLQAIY